MCGIFLSIAASLPQTLLKCREYDAAEIATLVDAQRASQTVLSKNDQDKVKNAGTLRQCLQELARLSMKNHSARIKELKVNMEALAAAPATPDELPRSESLDSTLIEVMARGPDHAQMVELLESGWALRALSSVLSLRQPFSTQPHCTDRFIFQFNGELYNPSCLDDNDVEFAWNLLSEALNDSSDPRTALAGVLSKLKGEFAFTLVDKHRKIVYFGKDVIGKRSLLFLTKDGLTVSSVLSHLPAEELIECEPGLLYAYSIDTENLTKQSYTRSLELTLCRSNQSSVDYSETQQRVRSLYSHLSKSCQVRQTTVHPLHPTKSQVAVLFSGGLDCTVIAALLAENYASMGSNAIIDLLTVGFENPRTGLLPLESPDRRLSERSWFELSKRFSKSSVSFRLVQVDVSYAQWLSCRNRVLGLIHPTATEMDLSIAIAFYFASQTGTFDALKASSALDESVTWTQFQSDRTKYVEVVPGFTSSAKVLFSGLGADELYGGYSRHESIFDSVGENAEQQELHECYDALSKSLLHDITIIYQRNLGRDDRAISSWGKELRYPYLDEEVVEFSTNSVEPHYKVKFDWTTMKTKKGEKRVKNYSRKYILRQLAHFLGLPMAAEEMKRAIQFGAKSAKLELGQSKTKGTEKVTV